MVRLPELPEHTSRSLLLIGLAQVFMLLLGTVLLILSIFLHRLVIFGLLVLVLSGIVACVSIYFYFWREE
jgi:uncharacterized membrane-anchored protein